MARYEEICQAYTEIEPRRIAIDQIVRALPEKLRQAISDDLGAPAGYANSPTHMYKRPTPYVHVVKKILAENGVHQWEPCQDESCYRIDADNMLQFTVCLVIEQPIGSLTVNMVYFTFSIEDINERSVRLRIQNSPGSISIDLRDANGFAKAAATITDWLKDSLRNPETPLGPNSAIGFGR